MPIPAAGRQAGVLPEQKISTGRSHARSPTTAFSAPAFRSKLLTLAGHTLDLTPVEYAVPPAST
jgi:hypothetical protein